ncbi:MAG: DNA primase [Polaromonas sp.]|nr:DNA primase [Polaromonas sp.]
MSIPQSFIQELLARVDVVDVVGQHVQLKKGGANFMGLCPFHGEKSPSFSVSPSKQFYHCFGCGANGNAISFLMEHVGMGFVEAVKDLAQQTGLQIPEDDTPPQDRARQKAIQEQQQSLTALLNDVAKGYQRHLRTSPRAIEYLKGRGLSGEIARAFGLGYAPQGWRALASMVPDYADARLVEAGLVIAPDGPNAPEPLSAEGHPPPTPPGHQQAKRYDRFRDRIMFPIRNVKGETIGFGGRVLDKGEPKYLNSPETPVFSKGRELYGLFEARTPIRAAGYALVTEGYMDVVALAQLGFANAVATLGTACTAEHVHKLFRFTDAVVFSFDGDAAGQRAAVKAMVASLPFAQDTRSIKFLFLPPEHDPDSFIRANGAPAFAQRVQEAVPLSQFMQDTAAARCDLATAEGRALMASHAKPLWSALPDGALKRQLLGELAQRIGLAVTELSDLWQLAPETAHKGRHGPGKPHPAEHPWEPMEPDSVAHPFGEETWTGSEGPLSRPHGTGGKRPTKPWTPNKSKKWTPADREDERLRAGAVSLGGQAVPHNTRADFLARTLLSHPQAPEWLTSEDQHLLAKQAEPLGSLFRWLEAQWHEHGAQTWAVLQQAMHTQPFADTANRLMGQALMLQAPAAGAGDTAPSAPPDTQREVREALRRMHIDDLMARERQALAEANHHPEALQTYKTLYERRLALQQPAPSSKV